MDIFSYRNIFVQITPRISKSNKTKYYISVNGWLVTSVSDRALAKRLAIAFIELLDKRQ